MTDSTEPSHQEAHIHHAHWFALDPGNKEDNYFRGNAEWIFGNGDEETRGDFRQRSAADPKGPEYGAYIARGHPQTMIYMLHNKTAAPLNVYIELDVVFKHGTPEELEKIDGREHRDVAGTLFGVTYDVPAQAGRRRHPPVRARQPARSSSGPPRRTARSSAWAATCTRAASR